jgi:hypothetical protein
MSRLQTSTLMQQGVELKAMTETRNLVLSIVETVAETVAELFLARQHDEDPDSKPGVLLCIRGNPH